MRRSVLQNGPGRGVSALKDELASGPRGPLIVGRVACPDRPYTRLSRFGLSEAGLDELPHERLRERALRLEVKCAFRLLVAGDVRGERRERAATEGVVGAAFAGCEEARDDSAIDAERGHGVADALVGVRHDRLDGLTEGLERLAPVGWERLEVVVDRLRLRTHASIV